MAGRLVNARMQANRQIDRSGKACPGQARGGQAGRQAGSPLSGDARVCSPRETPCRMGWMRSLARVEGGVWGGEGKGGERKGKEGERKGKKGERSQDRWTVGCGCRRHTGEGAWRETTHRRGGAIPHYVLSDGRGGGCCSLSCTRGRKDMWRNGHKLTATSSSALPLLYRRRGPVPVPLLSVTSPSASDATPIAAFEAS